MSIITKSTQTHTPTIELIHKLRSLRTYKQEIDQKDIPLNFHI